MIPIATTTITVKGHRPEVAIDPDGEGYGDAISELQTLSTGIRATITLPTGTRSNLDIDNVDIYSLRCDTIDNIMLTRLDKVLDETTQVEYSVSTVEYSYPEFAGLEHIKAIIYVTNGIRGGGDLNVPA